MNRKHPLSPLLILYTVPLLACAAAFASCGDDDDANSIGGGPDASQAPRLEQPEREGTALAEKFLVLLQDKDVPGLQSFLAEGFTIQRADGSGAGKAEYLARLPEIGPFTIGGVVATQQNGVLVVRWTLSVNQVINGLTYATTPAPRLSTFIWDDGRWQLIAHANFNAPVADSSTPAR